MKIVLVCGHDGASDRKTGFHFWADILSRRGHDVRFVTAGSSLISLLKKNGKPLKTPFNRWVALAPRFLKYTWLPPVHPLCTGSDRLDRLLAPVFALYPLLVPRSLLREVRDADFVIVENGAGPLLVPVFLKHAPDARYIYNVSDRFGVVKFHPLVVRGNIDALPVYDLIRLNAEAAGKDLPEGTKAVYIPQAIDKSLFDAARDTPYATGKNAISVGDMLFDSTAIEILAENYPDWTFHLFGKNARTGKSFPNIREYGERPFQELAPYIKFADIGLAPYADTPDMEYLGQSSLKFVQYSYCGLPVVAPMAACGHRANIIGYTNGRDRQSVVDAFRTAIVFDRSRIDKSDVPDWEDVIDRMLAMAAAGEGRR